MDLQYDSAITVFGFYLRKKNTYIHQEICTWMLTAALFVIPTAGNYANVLQWANSK